MKNTGGWWQYLKNTGGWWMVVVRWMVVVMWMVVGMVGNHNTIIHYLQKLVSGWHHWD